MKKRFRRMLAAVLCVLVLGTGAATAAFTDADSIGAAYAAAVDHMAASGVLSGFPDGSFQPRGTLTREQAAKIICCLLIGEKETEALTCAKAPFDDVSASRWSAPKIAWCSEHGIINGYGNGLFGPEDKLTGEQFAKMLLCALEKGPASRYVGADWAAAVREDGARFGLFNGDAAMASDAPLQRQQAALLAYNAISSDGQQPADGGTQPGTPDEDPGAPEPQDPDDGSDVIADDDGDELPPFDNF